MVKIRLKRMGQKKAPFYRVVILDHQETEDSSQRSVTMIQLRNQA